MSGIFQGRTKLDSWNRNRQQQKVEQVFRPNMIIISNHRQFDKKRASLEFIMTTWTSQGNTVQQ